MNLQEANKKSINKEFLDSLKSEDISFWIDSSGGPGNLCNNSFYGKSPKYYIYGSIDDVVLKDLETGAVVFESGNCFDFLEEKINDESHNEDGIFVGYISYDLYQQSSLKKCNTTVSYPNFFFAYFENSVSAPSKIETTKIGSNINSKLNSNMTDGEYLEKVKEIKEEIKKGNVYQANLTREYFLKDSGNKVDDLEIYLKLREASPNPYGCFFKTPFISILSSSPEEFIYLSPSNNSPRKIRTRPIKGTLPLDSKEVDFKNKAENIMIVDLERNDLGRICNYNSIEVKNLLEVESYKHLNHVVSTIEGDLKNDIGLKEIFNAIFPGGSITGAPKIAAIKLIDKLEPTSRGAYTGTFGYIRTNGEMNFNILIRTIFCQDSTLKFNVGGGIIADSDPENELEEIRIKAKGIIDTLGIGNI